jgi:hypothetical protein
MFVPQTGLPGKTALFAMQNSPFAQHRAVPLPFLDSLSYQASGIMTPKDILIYQILDEVSIG